MRSDFTLYGVAVICFILGALFAAGAIQGYTLSQAAGVTVTVVFFLIGIIAAAVGFSARPKPMMPITEPTPISTSTSPFAESTPPAEEPVEIVTPPPAPVEEITVSPGPSMSQPAELSTPIAEAPAETIQQTPIEAPAETTMAERPKPARRRRKKATA